MGLRSRPGGGAAIFYKKPPLLYEGEVARFYRDGGVAIEQSLRLRLRGASPLYTRGPFILMLTPAAPLAALQETLTWEPAQTQASPHGGPPNPKPPLRGGCAADPGVVARRRRDGGVVNKRQSSRRLCRHPPLHKEGFYRRR